MADQVTRQIRETARLRRLSTLIGLLLGLGLATMHWLGLVAGGILVALPAKTPRNGLLSGVTFGLVAAVGFLVGPLLAGTLSRVIGTGLPAILAVVSPLVLGLLGSLIRVTY